MGASYPLEVAPWLFLYQPPFFTEEEGFFAAIMSKQKEQCPHLPGGENAYCPAVVICCVSTIADCSCIFSFLTWRHYL
jgi:hypothetical protein